MLNVSNIGLVRYKTVTMATMGSIIHIVFFTHQLSPHNTRPRSQRLSVCRWGPLHAADKLYGQNVSCGHITHLKFLCFSSNIKYFFPLITISLLDAFNSNILLYEHPVLRAVGLNCNEGMK